MKISDIDKNLKVETSLAEKDIRFFDVCDKPFSLYGVSAPNGNPSKFRRMPEDVARKVSDGVYVLHTHTAGGRIRFKTDSKYVAVKAEFPQLSPMSHMAHCGIFGFSLYVTANGKQMYRGSFLPNGKTDYEGVVYLSEEGVKEVTIYMPLYNDVSKVYIGLSDSSELYEADKYAVEKPVVYYGSSITQGGCASRPGNSYQGHISRKFDCNYINLGFSGNARGEQVMADYIAGLDMSAFVLDYDHNAPTAEHLEETHESFFKTVRKANPDLPIIMVTRPKKFLSDDEEKRHAIVKKTYDNAVADGDKNVYFVSGKEFFEVSEFDDATVDGCHPTDLGFFLMAKKLSSVLENILK